MTDHVFVSAVFVARQEKLEALGEAIAAVVDATRSEQGCLRYDPHCCQDDVCRYFFYEEWESQKHLDDHMTTPHFLTFIESMKELLAEAPEVKVWKQTR